MVCDRSSLVISFGSSCCFIRGSVILIHVTDNLFLFVNGTHYSVNASFVDAIPLNTLLLLQFVSNGRFPSFIYQLIR